MFDVIIAQLVATSLLEAVSVILGLAYLVLIVWRVRWGWIAGGVASAMQCYLFAEADLPMQAALQVYYVGMSVYGFWHWSSQSAESPVRVTTWPLLAHLGAAACIVGASALSAHILAAETGAAWPFLDSFVTWGSLFTTWLVARAKLENWLYWLVVDAVLAYLSAMQGLYLIALLSIVYLGIVTGGYFKWLRLYRASAQSS